MNSFACTPWVPSFSIIIPSFNSGKYIEHAIDSVLRQGVPAEIIVQDGGSTDNTVSILNSYGSHVSYRSETDAGQSQALNRALCRATGNVIGWLNADDEYADGALQAALEAFLQEPVPDIVFGDSTTIDNNSVHIKSYSAGEWSHDAFMRRGMIAFSGSMFIKKSVFDEFGYFDESLDYCMDYEFVLRISKSTIARYVERPIGRFRIHTESKTGNEGYRFVKEAHIVRLRFVEKGAVSMVRSLGTSLKELAYIATRPVWWSPLWIRIRSHKRL